MKKNILSFIIGMIAILILSIPAFFILTIYLDSANASDFTIGKSFFTAYSFMREPNGFSFTLGPGVLGLGIIGGFISVGLTTFTSKFIKVK